MFCFKWWLHTIKCPVTLGKQPKFSVLPCIICAMPLITVELLRRLQASLVAQTVKNLPAMRETWVQSLGWEDILEEGMATHSSILAWRIPWTEEPAGYSPWGHRESDMAEQLTLSLSKKPND